MLYPLFIFKTEEGFDGYFPDVEGCFFAGDNIEDTIRNAETAFGQHMEILTEQGGHVPAPQNPAIYLADSRLKEDNGIIGLIEIDPAKYESKAIKFNLTMPNNLLTAIDKFIAANKHYKNRSAFLAELARKEIAIK
nr:type II toxin-antitoxin system HicB family antitoxin [uncultured Moellerella sp.]